MDTSTLYTIQYIITAGVEKLYSFTVSPQVLHTLEKVMKLYLGKYIDRPLKSLQILEVVEPEQ